MSPSDFTNIDYSSLFCLFKGEPGTRKSTAALSFPKPQYWFDYDHKMEALGLPMKEWNVDPTLIHYDKFTNWDRGLQQLEAFKLKCPYKTVIIDSFTFLADAINRQTLKVKGSSKADGGKRIAGIPVNSIEDFNAEESALSEAVAICKEIKEYHHVNIILIGHVVQKSVKSPEGVTHISRTIVTAGKGIAQKIPGACSETYHFNVKTGFTGGTGEYGLYTIHTGDDMARSSLPLPPHIVFNNDPLYDKWIKPAIDKMQGGKVTVPPGPPNPFLPK